MAYKITGSVLTVGPTQTFSAKSGNIYTKRDLVITVRLFDIYTGKPTEDSGNTPKFIFMGDKCSMLDQFKPGDIVTINFDISGRAYDKDGRTEYFTEVRPFRVDFNQQPMLRQQTSQYAELSGAQPYQQPYEQEPIQAVKDDLPF